MSTEYAYFKGQIVPIDEAKISVKTHAFLYGTSIFEGIRGYWNEEKQQISMFRAPEHFERMVANAKIFHMEPPLTVDEMMETTKTLIAKNSPAYDMYIRPTMYADGVQIGPKFHGTHTELVIWTHALGNYVDISNGLSVCVSNWRRVDDNAIPPRAKAGGAYMNTAVIITDALKAGFDEAIVLSHDGTVSEGSAMNFFMVKQGKLVTPAKTDNILEGITRDTIMTLAKEEFGIETEARAIDRTELYTCDEAFYCGTGAQVAPITKIDNRPVGDGKVGEITKKLQTLYFDVARNSVEKYSHWCTPIQISAPATA